MRGVVAAIVLSGCGRVAFDARVDANGDLTDGDADARAVRWKAPRVLTEFGTGLGDSGPSLTADLLTIFWTMDQGVGGVDIWTATRATPTSQFTNFTNVTALNTPAQEYSPEISPDGMTLYFNSDRFDTGDVFYSQGGGTTWSAAQPAPGIPTTGYQGDVAITPDGLTIVYDSGARFWRASRGDTASPFGNSVALREAEIDPDIASPTVAHDGDVVYFHAGQPRDLYVMRWNGIAYSTPVPVVELNTPQREADPFVNDDETYMVYDCNGSICETTPEP